MLRVNTTVVAVVGATDVVDGRGAPNVGVLRSDADAPALERARMAWEQARRTNRPYLLHDADPLAWVADSWVRRFDGQGAVGELEVAVAETLAQWRAGTLDLPDYYLVIDPEDLDRGMRHWFLGVLGAAAPRRVVTGRSSRPVVEHVAELRAGPWWPALDRVLADLDQVVPELAGPLATDVGPTELLHP